jgi:hypothetical protein
MGFVRQLFCRHRWTWVRNIHGDEINLRGGKRSVWWCHKCHKEEFREQLVK